jgi:hypothetical protein
VSVPVKDMQLTRLDDGFQELRIELDDEHGTVLTWRGRLSIEADLPLKDLAVQWGLHLEAWPGGPDEPWGRISVTPPQEPNWTHSAAS